MAEISDLLDILKRIGDISSKTSETLKETEKNFETFNNSIKKVAEEALKTGESQEEAVKRYLTTTDSTVLLQQALKNLEGITITSGTQLEKFSSIIKLVNELQTKYGVTIYDTSKLIEKAIVDEMALKVKGRTESLELIKKAQIEELKTKLEAQFEGNEKLRRLSAAYISKEIEEENRRRLKERAETLIHSRNLSDILQGYWARMRLTADTAMERMLGTTLTNFSAIAAGIAGIGLIISKAIDTFVGYSKTLADSMYLSARAGGLTRASFDIVNSALQTTIRYAMPFMDLNEVMRLTRVAVQEYGLSLVFLQDSYRRVREDYISAQQKMIEETTKAATDIGLLAPALGISGEEAVKTMFKIGRDFRMQVQDLYPVFEIMAKHAGELQIPITDLLDPLLKVGEQFKFAGLSIEGTYKHVYELYDSVRKSGEAFVGLRAIIPDVVNIAKTTLETFAKLGAEAYLAYLGKPIEDIGIMWREAVMADPFKKMIATQERMMEIVRMTGTADIGAALALMIPELRALGPIGIRIGEFLAHMTEEDKRRFRASGEKDFYKWAMEQAPGLQREDMRAIARQIELQREPFAVIARLLEQIFQLLVTAIYPIMTSVVSKFLGLVTTRDIERLERMHNELIESNRRPPEISRGAMRMIER
jgi:hypothetical protein